MRSAIVIGAGPGGLCAALGLRRAGYSPIVCEAASELREIGSGITLWPNALRALELLDVADVIRAEAEPFRHIAMKRWDGRVMFMVPCTGAGGIGWAAALHRGALQSALAAAVGSSAIRLGFRC